MCIDSPEMITNLDNKENQRRKLKVNRSNSLEMEKMNKPLKVVIRSYFSLSLLTGMAYFSAIPCRVSSSLI